ncbi:cell wall-active antibiotics response protein LiaF [Alkalihalobacillus sp. AL-G]|uniref:cell wall-active antibiotics response protein LiaF n=1 Tax=Alkalihalobacillus sp. AL-G TaxID=2926399 RepID=UPI00272CBF3B|nr:cell wall-active antibiotics response protein LiaF [Alkalihalobacillus sp. AL-G]WLD93886.1 cell wall-active antibiotics response protein LiaF [Alkalihalobacillus sp. AL-G]
MFNKSRTDVISWFFVIGVLLLLLEISFNGGGPIFLFIITIGCIYFGRKRYHRTTGKVLFWFGTIGFIFTILNTVAFRFLLFAVLIYVIVRFAQSKQQPSHVKPDFTEKNIDVTEKMIYRRKPLLQNVIFGRQATPDAAYEWDDVNIQCGISDTVIDLSNTVLPKGESVIFARGFIGNIKVLVPYEVEVSISHSVFAGSSEIFDRVEDRLWNQSLLYKTEGYDGASHKVKIFTSMMIGDIGVKRI